MHPVQSVTIHRPPKLLVSPDRSQCSDLPDLTVAALSPTRGLAPILVLRLSALPQRPLKMKARISVDQFGLDMVVVQPAGDHSALGRCCLLGRLPFGQQIMLSPTVDHSMLEGHHVVGWSTLMQFFGGDGPPQPQPATTDTQGGSS